MSTGTRELASEALVPFAFRNRRAPYTVTVWGLPDPVRVVPVQCKTGVAASRRHMLPHSVAAAAAAIVRGHTVYAARWVCPSGSADAVILADAEAGGGLCKRCEPFTGCGGPCVYRIFDDAGALLYIGSTVSIVARISAHRSSAPWRERIGDVRVAAHPTVMAARSAEMKAIRDERPECNVAGSGRAA